MEETLRIPEWDDIPNAARPKVRWWLPAAAVDAEDLVTEMKQLKARGFGGAEVVGLLNTPEEVMAGPNGWNTENWNRMIALIDRTAQEFGMSMDVANGPGWPISMPTVESADDPAALTEMTWGVLDIGPEGRYQGPVPERRSIRPEGHAELFHVLAYQRTGEGALVRDSYADLSAFASSKDAGAVMDVQFPAASNGRTWLIFAFFVQPAAQKTGNGRYYVIDHLSRAGAEACRAYWAPILRHEPYPSMESIFCDSLEYNVSLDWTRGLEREFEARRGYSILPYLPFLGYADTYPKSDPPGYFLEDQAVSDMVNQDYLETLTQCHCEYHLSALEEMAESFGKTVRYQVAYNKPYEEERCALYVAIPENEALGRPAMDGLKTMAAAAQLGRKARYSFECAAEFGNGYGQDYEDLLWWVKRSLMAGMNAQVLHGASYSGGYKGEYAEGGAMKGVEWPGYEAFGRVVSNNWNRTPSIADARGCLDAVARFNAIFQKTAKIDCAVYRASYKNDGCDSEFAYFEDDGALANAGYSYETVSAALLAHPNCIVRNGLLDEDGAAWQCLLIPPVEAVPSALLREVSRLLSADFPVIWFGDRPTRALYWSDWKTETDKCAWVAAMDAVWQDPRLVHGASVGEAVKILKNLGIHPRLELGGGMDLTTAVRTDANSDVRYYAVYDYNRAIFAPEESAAHDEMMVSAQYRKGTTKSTYHRPGAPSRRVISISLDAVGQVYCLNPWSGKSERLPFAENSGRMTGKIEIEEDELVLLAVRPSEPPKAAAIEGCAEMLPIYIDTLALEPFGPDTAGEKSFLRSGFGAPEKRTIKALKPWRQLDSALEDFVGRGTYSGGFRLDSVEPGRRYILVLGEVCDTFRVFVNDVETDFPDQTLKKVDVTNLVRPGENTLKVQVTSNLYNRLLKDYRIPGLPIPIPYHPKDYGLYEAPGKPLGLQIL